MRNLLATLGLALAPTLAGCAIREVPLELPARPAEPRPEDVRVRFSYAPIAAPDLRPAWVDRDAEVSRGWIGVYAGGDPNPTWVEIQFWRSLRAGDEPAPAVVVTPILGGGKELARANCRALAAAGMHVVLVERGVGVLKEWWPVRLVELWMRRSVAARRAAVDFLVRRSDVDPERIGAFGISMGGVITTALMGAEPRLHSGVIALAGGDVPSIIEVSSEARLVDWRAARASVNGESEGEVIERLRHDFRSDPAALARYVDPRQVLLITTTLDTVVPHEAQLLLWERLGRPRRYDLPVGHYSGALFLPYCNRLAGRWLAARLGASPRPEQ